ncbi:universal stress protein [Streptomyces sp. HUAS 31]|uniref:universal stress protein n=1 Tax=Streptomyces sp. HUAS 31 TaxID=3020055 RepID=UPI002FDFFE3A
MHDVQPGTTQPGRLEGELDHLVAGTAEVEAQDDVLVAGSGGGAAVVGRERSWERVIITGVDRSACSRAAAVWAAREALPRGLPVRVVHVSPPDGPGTDAELIVVGLRGEGGGAEAPV